MELSRGKVPELPLGVLVAGTQGWMGYMIEQSLINRLLNEGFTNKVVSIVTQILVDQNDPSLQEPSKFIGQTYSEDKATSLAAQFQWKIKKDKGRNGFRRVVGSPMPLEVINRDAIRSLLDQDWVVICAGGGGIPVYREPDGTLEGVDAVIDKDRASAVLGADIHAEELLILTEVEKVALNFNTKNQVDLDQITLNEAKRYLEEGHFPPGSMGPKIESAIHFREQGGERVVITDLAHIVEAIDGNGGTQIVG